MARVTELGCGSCACDAPFATNPPSPPNSPSNENKDDDTPSEPILALPVDDCPRGSDG